MNTGRNTDGRNDAQQGRLAALVIAGTVILYLVAQFLGASLGIPLRYMFLIDLAALGALIWAIVVTMMIWRKSRKDEG